jgi:hypothetical protein
MILTRKYILGISIVAVCGSLLYFLFDPSLSNSFPKCIFHSLTQLECPGCGSQRAIHSLLHGNILQAADFNLMAVVFLPLLLYSGLVAVANTFFHQQWSQGIFYSPTFVKIVLLVVLLFWVLRNIPIDAFHWLSAGY